MVKMSECSATLCPASKWEMGRYARGPITTQVKKKYYAGIAQWIYSVAVLELKRNFRLMV
jgi:hypothetical protein